MNHAQRVLLDREYRVDYALVYEYWERSHNDLEELRLFNLMQTWFEKKISGKILSRREKTGENEMKLILFNGPPRSGKDTSAAMAMNFLAEKSCFGAYGYHYRFAEPLKDAVHALFGLAWVDTEHFNDQKSTKLDILFGMTPRAAYIWLSEQCAKPKFGNDFFAKVAVNRLKNFASATVVISDCGFQPEVDVLINEFGRENVHVIHVHRMGCDYKEDSRGYIKHPDLDHMYFLRNDGTMEHLREDVYTILRSIING